MGHTIEQIDMSTAPQSLLREMDDYYVVVEAEDLPGDPPTPIEMRIADWRHVSSHHPEFRWLLRDEDGIAAVAVAAYETEQNFENGFARVHVRPDKRGLGYARAISKPVLELLEESGRTRLDTWIKSGDPAEQLAESLGLKSVYGEKRSRLVISELDMDLMESWIARARERAPDYEVVYYRSPMPEEIIGDFCELAFIMNTAPREDFEEDDEVLTPEMWREMESNALDSKCQLHTLIAVHQPSGEMVGYTQIRTQDLQPDLAWQWDTGVDSRHRNKGLGRWLKAAMMQRVIGGYPALTRVDTYNAGSNAPMLNINVAMGFKPVHISNEWQGDLATVRKRLGV